MNVRAKFRCDSVTKTAYGGEIVKFSAVSIGNKEDNSFADATPSASVEMTISNKAVHGAFVPGAFYFSDFTPAA